MFLKFLSVLRVIDMSDRNPPIQPASMTYRRLEGHASGWDWWISIWPVTQDWRKFWKRFRGCFVSQSLVSTKTVVSKSGVKTVLKLQVLLDCDKMVNTLPNKQIFNPANALMKYVIFVTKAEIIFHMLNNDRKHQLSCLCLRLEALFLKMLKQHVHGWLRARLLRPIRSLF